MSTNYVSHSPLRYVVSDLMASVMVDRGKHSQFKSVHDGDSNAGDLLSTCTLSSHGSHTGVAWAHLLQGLGQCSF